MRLKFKPRLLPTVAALAMFVVMVGLGIWQIQRLHWKEGLLTEIDQRIHQAPQDVAAFHDVDGANYRPATATGVFQNDTVFYLVALSSSGEGGYHVVTPFKLHDGRMMLVDRGWIPYDRRDHFTKIEGETTLSGILRAPEHHLFTPANDAAGNNWYWLDVAAMGQGAALLPFVLQADAAPHDGGYPIGGQTRIDLPNNHLGYAVTWFSLAFVLLVIWGLASLAKNGADSTKSATAK